MDSALLLDSYGRKLLDELQANARLSIAELSRRIGLSATAVTERLKQMEEDGILEGYTARIDREALGLEVMAFIRMSCAGLGYHRMIDYAQSLEEVRECHHVTGGDDLILKVTTLDMAHLEALLESFLPYGTPTTSLVLSSPVSHRTYAASGKLASVAPKPRPRRRFQRG